MKSFRLFWQAVKSTRHEMWVSLQVLVAATLILSLLLYLVEHNAQPDVFSNYWDALLWSFMGYIGDPGEFAAYTPITFWGRVLKIACALINIAIFAVPAGLVAGGFSDAIADDKRESEIEGYRSLLAKSFHRIQDKQTKFRTVPRYVPLVDIQINQELDTKDIIDAVRSSEDYRMRNLASALPAKDNPTDRIVIETVPVQNRTRYGCCIDRGSKVTIVAPSAGKEVAVGNFAYYLALYGGFNYVSKEFEPDTENPKSYYLIDSDDNAAQYLDDLKRLTSGRDSWVIFIIASDSLYPEYLHFVTAVQGKLGVQPSTILDKTDFEKLYADVSDKMKNDFDILSELDTRYLPVGKKNVAMKIGGGADCNAFTLRVDWKFMAFSNQTIAVAYSLASSISEALLSKPISVDSHWKDPGFGY